MSVCYKKISFEPWPSFVACVWVMANAGRVLKMRSRSAVNVQMCVLREYLLQRPVILIDGRSSRFPL